MEAYTQQCPYKSFCTMNTENHDMEQYAVSCITLTKVYAIGGFINMAIGTKLSSAALE